MKIAVNARHLLKNKLEGIGYFTLEILRNMVRNHPEDEFLFFFDRPYSEEFVFAENVTAIVLSPPARHPFLFFIWYEFSIFHALKKHQPDVFFSPDNFLCLKTDVTTCLVVHDLAYLHFPSFLPFWQCKYYQYFMPLFFKKADKILAVSEFTKNDIIKNTNIINNNISIIYNACKPVFQAFSQAEKEFFYLKNNIKAPYFIYVGSLHPRKNIVRLLKAFDVFKRRTGLPHGLYLVGRKAWQTRGIEKTMLEIEAKNDVTFFDYKNEEEVAALMASSEALCYVSLFEGFGVPVLEAMNCDIPIITSKASAMQEIVGDAALLVNPFSVEEIAEAMEAIVGDGALRAALTANARARRHLFSWEKSSEAVYACLAAMVRK